MCTSLNGVAIAALPQPRNDELTTNYSQKATKASSKLYASILKFILYLFILNIVLMGNYSSNLLSFKVTKYKSKDSLLECINKYIRT